MDSITPSTAYAELGPTPRSTSSAPRVPPKIARIIGELGLRYRPSAQADLEAHAASLALLTRDVATADPAKLERAAQEWALRSRFMPKAAELLDLCRKQGNLSATELAARCNAELIANPKGRTDIHWVVNNGQIRLEHIAAPEGNAGKW